MLQQHLQREVVRRVKVLEEEVERKTKVSMRRANDKMKRKLSWSRCYAALITLSDRTTKQLASSNDDNDYDYGHDDDNVDNNDAENGYGVVDEHENGASI